MSSSPASCANAPRTPASSRTTSSSPSSPRSSHRSSKSSNRATARFAEEVRRPTPANLWTGKRLQRSAPGRRRRQGSCASPARQELRDHALELRRHRRGLGAGRASRTSVPVAAAPRGDSTATAAVRASCAPVRARNGRFWAVLSGERSAAGEMPKPRDYQRFRLEQYGSGWRESNPRDQLGRLGLYH